MSDLQRLADLVGIEPVYHDIWGHRRETSAATMRALIQAQGLKAGDDAEVAASLAEVERRVWRRLVAPVMVVEEGLDLGVIVSVPAGLDAGARLAWTLVEEDGGRHQGAVEVAGLAVEATGALDGRAFERRRLALAVTPPRGYHQLALDLDGADQVHADMTLIIVPARRRAGISAPPPGDGSPRDWGIGLQLYALRSERDWGIGDFSDLGRFAGIAGSLGAGLVGLNPLHALFPADPQHYGPYSPSSRIFLNILYIDVEAVPELALALAEPVRAEIAAPAFQAALAAARAAELVDYPAVAGLKMPVLERLFAIFQKSGDAARHAAFEEFRAEMGEDLVRHALFDALHEHFFRLDRGMWMWRSWPEAYRRPDSAEVAAFAAERADRLAFFAWSQWEADRQLAEAAAQGRRAGLSLGFYRDLAVAAHPGGAAAWADQGVLTQGASVGAPPDQFNLHGQNWGLAPLSPVGLFEAAYVPFVRLLRANMRHAGALRIDHVMALKHLFWIPADGGDGAYVRYPFADLLGIVALESARRNCLVIGEDLGTVPEGFRPAMREAGVLSYRVLYFERAANGDFLPPAAYPPEALVTVTTHDLATFKGFWTNRDLEWRRRLDLYPDPASRDKDQWDRGVDHWRLLRALSGEGLRPASYPNDEGGQPYRRELMEAVYRYLAGTPGRLLMMQIEDALDEDEQPNLPGTVDQHPNWRRRLSKEVEAIADDQGVRTLSAVIAASGRGARARE